MPRVQLPPTPATSTGPSPKDKQLHDMEGAFALPPASLKPSPPASPVSTRKRTLSGSARSKDDLPPPPSRARKIIQMKPKEDSGGPPVPTSPSVSTKSSSAQGKRKPPSATSAAGRKIARKTAHSIIERRRRSKMNEEFGVLKDMIPACKGVEMHKLAILQAGIEYVRYLQGCVEKLQDREAPPPFHAQRTASDAEDNDEVDEDEDEDEMDHDGRVPQEGHSSSTSPAAAQREHRQNSVATTATASTHPSPALRPNVSTSSLSSQRQLPPPLSSKTYSTSPPPLILHTPSQTGVSPAFSAIHFSPDLSRTYSNLQQKQAGKASPNILPLPQAAMPMPFTTPIHLGLSSEKNRSQSSGDGQAEATATAALLMMGNDRRSQANNKSSGMSVRDLLSH